MVLLHPRCRVISSHTISNVLISHCCSRVASRRRHSLTLVHQVSNSSSTTFTHALRHSIIARKIVFLIFCLLYRTIISFASTLLTLGRCEAASPRISPSQCTRGIEDLKHSTSSGRHSLSFSRIFPSTNVPTVDRVNATLESPVAARSASISCSFHAMRTFSHTSN